MSQEKTKITINPQAQFVIVGGDKDMIVKKDTRCQVGCNMRIYLDTSASCDDYQFKVKGILRTGKNAAVDNILVQDTLGKVKDKNSNDVSVAGAAFQLAGNFNARTPGGGNWNGLPVRYSQLLASLLYNCGIKSQIGCQIGYASNIQQDECGTYNGGWYKCQTEYYGNGFEGFVNPFIFNKAIKGFQLSYNADSLECFANYGTGLHEATGAGEGANSAVGYGFGNSKTPSICNMGLSYKSKVPCPSKLSLVCQQINNGQKGIGEGIPNQFKVPGEEDSETPKVNAALAQAQEKDQRLNAFSGICQSELQGVDINGYLTCANPENTSRNSARILKWSAGCVSKCKPIKCLPFGGILPQAFGINIGTPAYLSQDLNSTGANTLSRNNETLKADKTPVVCEAYCLFNFCGLNIPLFVDYMSNHPGSFKNGSTSIYSIDNTVGNILICGMRPSRITVLECNKNGTTCYNKHILDCRVEGGLNEDEE